MRNTNKSIHIINKLGILRFIRYKVFIFIFINKCIYSIQEYKYDILTNNIFVYYQIL